MSGRDQGDEDKGFLARWSQRKREAEQPKPAAPAVETGALSGPVAVGSATQKVEFDLSSLPKLGELTGTTDITAFLRKGVPEHLRNEALRKSWALDPAIRNYVNPALEYAYDWNTPGGVPGGGELGAGIDVARMVSQIMGSGEPAAEPSIVNVDPGKAPASDPTQSPPYSVVQESELELPAQVVRLGDETVSMAQKAVNAEKGSRIEVEQVLDSKKCSPAAPQQVV